MTTTSIQDARAQLAGSLSKISQFWGLPRAMGAIYGIVYLAREPILIDVEIRNGLEHEIRISRYSFSPNDWNGETIGVELHDIYRLPVMRQIGLKRPAINIEKMPLIQGASWVPIPPGTSKITTVDVRKWEVCDG